MPLFDIPLPPPGFGNDVHTLDEVRAALNEPDVDEQEETKEGFQEQITFV